ncbi:MAG: N-formylglutamate amidohydrolase [Gammaproteobacteria bacterium]|nr:N-formylglutamate amidohydrolase [Gammaproteobacteria bacterium]
MSVLPLALPVPHCGVRVPDEVKDICALTAREVIEDGDEGADEIYSPLEPHVMAFRKSETARAIVDLNRATDDFRKDGIIKTHTCWDVPVYLDYPDADTIAALIERYYVPYHQALASLSTMQGVSACIDCHTMAAHGPPVGPDPGQERPLICLGNVNHETCPEDWIILLARIMEAEFGQRVAVNVPFAGGYITRHYGQEKPWIQMELSRTDKLTKQDKTAGVLNSLRKWCAVLFQP